MIASPKISRFLLLTDASELAAGAVLMRKIDNRQRLIAVSSMTFFDTERKWSATERECFSLVIGCDKFAYFSKEPVGFVALVDHKALLYLDKRYMSNRKLDKRWQTRLAEF